MISRRKLLQSLGVAGAGALAPSGLLRLGTAWADLEAMATGVSYDPAPFTLGVASGYPKPDSVVLWTRLAPSPLTTDGGEPRQSVPARWAIGTDAGAVAATLAAGGGTAVTTDGAWGHSLHVEATGLSPATTYWYGFASEGVVSTIGRTRTAPIGATSQVRFAVASCQRFGDGWYSAYRHIGDENLDFVLHLGDYIYESSGSGRVRSHGDTVPVNLVEYRIKHALYKGDPDLRRAHALHPWILTWDDHEVFNNYIGTTVNAQRQGAAYQAYYEHLPIRLTAAGPPAGRSFRIYQQVQFGDLLDVALLDSRQYRFSHREPLLPNSYWPDHPDNTMLGAQQKAWLKDLLATEGTKWRALGNPNPILHALNVTGGLPQEGHEVLNDAGVLHIDKFEWSGGDAWDGFGQEKYELLRHILDHGKGDVVALTGDYHRHLWQNIPLDVDNPASPIVLPEFAGTSITSNGVDGSDPAQQAARPAVYGANRFLRYLGYHHGYMVCDVTPNRWRTTAWGLRHSQDPTLDARLDVNATKFAAAVFDVNPGDPRMHHVGGEDPSNPFPVV